MSNVPVAKFQRDLDQRLTKAEDAARVLEHRAAEVLRPTVWSANVEDLNFYDRGMTIPEWQDIGCEVQFESYGGISVLSIGCSLVRMYASTALHYEIVDTGGSVIVPRNLLRVATNRYNMLSGTQVAVGRVFAHALPSGTYIARLLTRTEHANSTDWAATLTIHNASISVRT